MLGGIVRVVRGCTFDLYRAADQRCTLARETEGMLQLVMGNRSREGEVAGLQSRALRLEWTHRHVNDILSSRAVVSAGRWL